MKQNLTLTHKSDPTSISIGYKGDITTFDVKRGFKQPIFRTNTDEQVYDVVNTMLGDMPEHKLDNLYRKYAELAYRSERINNTEKNKELYQRYMSDLFSEGSVTTADIAQWVDTNIRAPDSIGSTFNDNEGTFTKELTFLKSDYINICVVTIVSKMLSPLLGSYMRLISMDVGDKKDVSTLLVLPPVVTTLPGYIKIYDYICEKVDSNDISIDFIISKSIGRESIHNYVMAAVFIHRLLSGTILSNNDSKNIIKHIYNHVVNKTKASYSSKIKSKAAVGSYMKEDGTEVSVFEEYRFKEPLTLSTQVELANTGNEKYYLPLLQDSIVIRDFNAMVGTVNRAVCYPHVVHIQLMKVILADIIDGAAFQLFNQTQVKKLMLVCFLLLRENHPYIAVFMVSGMGLTDDGEEIPHPLITRSRLSDDLIARLTDYCPLRLGNKEPPRILRYVDQISKQLIQTWTCMLPARFLGDLDEPYISADGRELIVSESGKKYIGELILDCGNLIKRSPGIEFDKDGNLIE